MREEVHNLPYLKVAKLTVDVIRNKSKRKEKERKDFQFPGPAPIQAVIFSFPLCFVFYEYYLLLFILQVFIEVQKYPSDGKLKIGMQGTKEP